MFDSPLYRNLGPRRFWLGARGGGIVFFRFVPPAVVKFARLALRRLRSRSARAAVSNRRSDPVDA